MDKNKVPMVILLLVGNFLPFTVYALLPRQSYDPTTLYWLGMACSLSGMLFSFLLKRMEEPHYKERQQLTRLEGFPRNDWKSVLTRVSYTLGFIGFRLNAVWIVISLLVKVTGKQ
jgi:hypothetical protein